LSAPQIIPTARITALLVDLDGVVTRTASVHAQAWKRLFDEFLRQRAERLGEEFTAFDASRDYNAHVDGKPRYRGVADFLAARGIELPHGEPGDEPGFDTVCALGNAKQRYFVETLHEEGAAVFEDAVDLLDRARAAGMRLAVVTSSANCSEVLAAAGLEGVFEAQVDGNDGQRLGLSGKPDADSFVLGTERLGLPPLQAAVLEDAVAGVEAGRNGAFGWVVGVDRVGHGDDLAAAGADLVSADLAGLELADRPVPPRPLADTTAVDRLLGDRRPAVFLDYDGTLTPIVARPELAVLDDAVRDTLRRLGERLPVAILSGRKREDVAALVGIDTLYYAGSHGFDIAGPGGLEQRYAGAEALVPVIAAIAGKLQQRLASIEGVIVEDKEFALAVHYRQVAPERVDEIRTAVEHVVAGHAGLRVAGGKKVFEIRPALDWHKGRALLWLGDTLGLDSDTDMAVYIGDDETDEDAFAAIERDGLGLRVGAPGEPSRARYCVPDTAAVHAFLQRLLREVASA